MELPLVERLKLLISVVTEELAPLLPITAVLPAMRTKLAIKRRNTNSKNKMTNYRIGLYPPLWPSESRKGLAAALLKKVSLVRM